MQKVRFALVRNQLYNYTKLPNEYFLICTTFTFTSQKLITLSRNTGYHCIQVQFALFILIIYPIKKKKG